MRLVYLIRTLLGITLLIGCAEFPTAYSRIEPEKVRLLDFIYEPAEAAPGDTVLLKGSRSLELERLTPIIEQERSVATHGGVHG